MYYQYYISLPQQKVSYENSEAEKYILYCIFCVRMIILCNFYDFFKIKLDFTIFYDFILVRRLKEPMYVVAPWTKMIVRPVLIFPGSGKQITPDERAYHKNYFQSNAKADTNVCVEWAKRT